MTPALSFARFFIFLFMKQEKETNLLINVVVLWVSWCVCVRVRACGECMLYVRKVSLFFLSVAHAHRFSLSFVLRVYVQI